MKITPACLFVRTRQVAFHDTDASGVAHFTRLLCLVEEVEHEYLRSRGLEVLSPIAAGPACMWRWIIQFTPGWGTG